jgi:hypothetical protein
MATITVKRIIDRASDILQSTETDEDDRSFPESDLVEYCNTEVRDLVSKYPDAYAVTRNVLLAEGVEQYIPNDGIALLTVTMNMGTDGDDPTPGTPVIKCELAEMQRADRSWNTATAQEEIYNFMPDPADPRHFWVYPPSDGTGYISEEFSAVPDTVVWDEDGDWETAVVPILEKYVQKLEKRIIARAYKRDTDIPGNIIRENDNQQEVMQDGN